MLLKDGDIVFVPGVTGGFGRFDAIKNRVILESTDSWTASPESVKCRFPRIGERVTMTVSHYSSPGVKAIRAGTVCKSAEFQNSQWGRIRTFLVGIKTDDGTYEEERVENIHA